MGDVEPLVVHARGDGGTRPGLRENHGQISGGSDEISTWVVTGRTGVVGALLWRSAG